MGHFGAWRTLALLFTRYWWNGMSDNVKSVVKHCAACDRVNGMFTTRTVTLNPLPISGLLQLAHGLMRALQKCLPWAVVCDGGSGALP